MATIRNSYQPYICIYIYRYNSHFVEYLVGLWLPKSWDSSRSPWRKSSLSVLISSIAVPISSPQSPMGWIHPPFRPWLADCQFQWHQWEFQPPTADPPRWPRREASSSQPWIGPSEPWIGPSDARRDALWLADRHDLLGFQRKKYRMQVDVPSGKLT